MNDLEFSRFSTVENGEWGFKDGNTLLLPEGIFKK